MSSHDVRRLLGVAAAVLVTAAGGARATVLTVWDQWYRGAENQVIEQLNREFAQAHKGVTINRSARPLDDLKATLKLAISSPDGPQVANVNQGAPDMGALVGAGLLVDLDAYATRYGWTQRFSEGLLARNRWGSAGEFGIGRLYGVAPQAEVVGVYYNKELFDRAGVRVPTTFEEFDQALARLKAAGITPITFGNLDGWPAIHVYGAIQHALLTDRRYLDDLIYGRGGSWKTAVNEAAARTLVSWVQQGYFTAGFEGIGYDDSWRLFAAGQGAMMITGSWLAGELSNNPAFGFFRVPAPASRADRVALQVGGSGIPLSITVRAQDAVTRDLAAQYLDWMVSNRAAQVWLEHGFLPAMPIDLALVRKGTLLGDIVEVWTQVNRADALGHYLDWASPTMYDTITAALQELMGGRITPAQFLDRLDADYQAYLASRR